MELLQAAEGIIERVQEIAFGLSIIISGLFLMEYRRYSDEQERKEMIDNFLDGSH